MARTAVGTSGETEGNLKEFYRSFLEARIETGEGKPPSFEKFRQEIEKHVETIRRSASCERVDFRLYLENKRVALKAKPLKEEENSS